MRVAACPGEPTDELVYEGQLQKYCALYGYFIEGHITVTVIGDLLLLQLLQDITVTAVEHRLPLMLLQVISVTVTVNVVHHE